MSKILYLFQAMLNSGYERYLQMFAVQMDDFTNMLDAIFVGKPVNASAVNLIYHANKQAMINFCFEMPDMSDLAPHDRFKIMERNAPALFGLFWGVYSYSQDLHKYYEGLMLHGNDIRPFSPAADKLFRVIEERGLLGKVPKFWDMSLFLAPGAGEEDSNKAGGDKDGDQHEYFVAKLNLGVRDTPHFLADYVAVMLLAQVLLYSSDFRDPLQDKKKVQAKQDKYMTLLHRYLRTRHGKRAPIKLGEAIMTHDYSRRLHDTFTNRMYLDSFDSLKI